MSLNMQTVKEVAITEGDVRTIHDSDGNLLWGRLAYDTKYAGDTTQQTYTGKNLFDKVSATSGQAAYVLNADGTITTLKYNNLDGRKYFNNLSLAAGTYTLSYVPSTTNTQKNIRFSLRRTVLGEDIVNTSFTYNDNVKQSYTFTLETDVTDLGICIEKNNSGGDATVPLVLKDIQLEAGNQATSYEPFTGSSSTQMVPSPNPDYPQDIQVVTGEQTVKVHGKNLWNFGNKESDWHASSTVVNMNSISVTGTTNNGTQSSTFSVPCKPNTTYTLSRTLNVITAGDDTGRIYIQDNNGYITNIATSQLSKTFTTSATASKIVLIFFANVIGTPSTAPEVEFSNVQVEEGTATSYEAYQSQDYTVNLTGKNLWPDTPYLTGYVLYVYDGSNFPYTGGEIYRQDDVIVGAKYTLTTTPSVNGNMRVMAYKADNTFISQIGVLALTTGNRASVTVTIPAQTAYIKWSFATGMTDSQLELGEQSTAYTPYYNYELCKINTYQDYIYKSGDDWYVHKAIGKALGNAVEWGNNGTNTNYTQGVIKGLDVGADLSTNDFAYMYYANMFPNGDTAKNQSQTPSSSYRCNGTTSTSYIRVNIGIDYAPDWTAFQSIVQNLVLYYALATTTDTLITDPTLISQLDAIHEWLTRYGYNATVSGNLPLVINQTNIS